MLCPLARRMCVHCYRVRSTDYNYYGLHGVLGCKREGPAAVAPAQYAVLGRATAKKTDSTPHDKACKQTPRGLSLICLLFSPFLSTPSSLAVCLSVFCLLLSPQPPRLPMTT